MVVECVSWAGKIAGRKRGVTVKQKTLNFSISAITNVSLSKYLLENLEMRKRVR